MSVRQCVAAAERRASSSAVGRLSYGAAFHMGTSRSFDTFVIGSAARIAYFDVNAFRINPDDLGNNLTMHRVGTYALIADAAAQAKITVGVKNQGAARFAGSHMSITQRHPSAIKSIFTVAHSSLWPA